MKWRRVREECEVEKGRGYLLGGGMTLTLSKEPLRCRNVATVREEELKELRVISRIPPRFIVPPMVRGG